MMNVGPLQRYFWPLQLTHTHDWVILILIRTTVLPPQRSTPWFPPLILSPKGIHMKEVRRPFFSAFYNTRKHQFIDKEQITPLTYTFLRFHLVIPPRQTSHQIVSHFLLSLVKYHLSWSSFFLRRYILYNRFSYFYTMTITVSLCQFVRHPKL